MLDPKLCACQANNSASKQLVLAGNFEAALRGFRTALNYLRHQTDLISFCQRPFPKKTQWLFRITLQSNDDEVSPHNSFCYYNRIMIVDEDEEDDSFISMVILFNLGITYHHSALSSAQDKDASFKKALELYKMVLAVMQQRCDDDNTAHREDSAIRLILLATFSNMGHIYSHGMNPYEEKVCQQHLLALLDIGKLWLDVEEAQVFLINAQQRAEWAPAA